MRWNNKGLSQVVTIVIRVVFVIVAVGIVWTVVEDILKEQSSQVSLDTFTIDLKIEKAVFDSGNNNLKVDVKRNPGEGNLEAIKFLISDGKNTVTLEKPTSIIELGKESFTLDLADKGLTLTELRDVSIVPVLKEKTGEVTSTYKIQSGSVEEGAGGGGEIEFNPLDMEGLISWWTFDEDLDNDGDFADDITSNYDGVLGIQPTNIPSIIAGQNGGQAYSFNGNGNQIAINRNASWNIKEYSIAMWINPVAGGFIFSNQNPYSFFGGWGIARGPISTCPRGNICSYISENTRSGGEYILGPDVPLNEWQYVVITVNLNDPSKPVNFYIDGLKIGETKSHTKEITFFSPVTHIANLGTQSYFRGALDEVMVFGRAIEPEEVSQLYNYFTAP